MLIYYFVMAPMDILQRSLADVWLWGQASQHGLHESGKSPQTRGWLAMSHRYFPHRAGPSMYGISINPHSWNCRSLGVIVLIGTKKQ